MGTADVLGIGISGANIASRRLATTSHNIANAQTKGFSRQRVEAETRAAQTGSVGALGTGVQVSSIGRIHDEFIVSELRTNASIANNLQMNYDFTSQIDNMLSDPNAGLSPSLQTFFASINNVANDPASQSARQVMIGEANALATRFSYLDSRFESLKKGTNETLKSHIGDVNTLAKSIADVNGKIVLAKGISQGEPSDLLDQRDRLLHQLSERVSVQKNQQEDGSINVFVGNGQTLVLGIKASQLGVQANKHDPSELDVTFVNNKSNTVITKFMKGGTVGGLLDFREGMLAQSQNELGRIAIGVTKTFNAQHNKGMTLENKLGSDFFSAIDKTAPLTLPAKNNEGDYTLKTTISNTDSLTTSDYFLNYHSGLYTLIRERDDVIIDTFTSIPHDVESEGLKIELERGTQIVDGDSYMIRPTTEAARSFAVEIERANDVAAAAPVRIRTSVNNLGDIKAKLTNVTNINSPSFTAKDGMLSPSITVHFIDEHHIELLDDKGKVIQTQQLDQQNKAIPATPAVPGEPGTPATPAIPANPGGKHEGRGSLSGIDNDNDDSHDGSEIPKIETSIYYNSEVGLNLFPTPSGKETGYNVQLSGKARAGDTFVIEYNTDAVGNNINILELGDLQNKATLDNGTSNYNEVYGQLVSRIGSKTHELDVNQKAQNILYEQAKAQRESVSGVNLDEEAANLIRYQNAYEANAQVIGAASEMFDTLINVLRR
ncbi:MAG: flagellar hook-associated protein FlgK [Woeseiaceae bacterium]